MSRSVMKQVVGVFKLGANIQKETMSLFFDYVTLQSLFIVLANPTVYNLCQNG